MVYASTDNLRCYKCGDIGHKRISCPHKQRAEVVAGTSQLSGVNSETNMVGTRLLSNVEREAQMKEDSDDGDKIEVNVNAADNIEKKECLMAVLLLLP